MKSQPNALNGLLGHVPHAARVSMNKGLIYALGEMQDAQAIPALWEALRTADNSSVREELIHALAKCRARAVVPDLFNQRYGYLPISATSTNSCATSLAGASAP